jgi:hypothetical protein
MLGLPYVRQRAKRTIQPRGDGATNGARSTARIQHATTAARQEPYLAASAEGKDTPRIERASA